MRFAFHLKAIYVVIRWKPSNGIDLAPLRNSISTPCQSDFPKEVGVCSPLGTISPLSSIFYLVNRKQCGNVCYLLCLCDCDCERQLWWLLVNQLGPQIGTSERKKTTNCRIFLITLGNDFLSDIRTLIQTNPQQICGLPSGSVGFCLGPLPNAQHVSLIVGLFVLGDPFSPTWHLSDLWQRRLTQCWDWGLSIPTSVH